MCALESGIQLKESGIQLTIGTGFRVQVTLTKTGIQWLESEIHGVKSRIPDCLGFPYMERFEYAFYLFKEQLGFKKLSGRFTTMEKSTANDLKIVFHS